MERNEGCKKCAFAERAELANVIGSILVCTKKRKRIERFDPIYGTDYYYECPNCEDKNKNGKCKAFKRKLSFWERVFG
jgi:hypothetical protein